MSEMWEMQPQVPSDRRYTTMANRLEPDPSTSDLHAWSIYRQNLNSDFTDSALGTDERSPLPYGNFQLREQTVQSILRNPRLGPRSELGGNMYAYLKFGLPRVLPPKGGRDGISSGYDSADERNQQSPMGPGGRSRSRNTERMHVHSVSRNQQHPARAKSETDLRDGMIANRFKSNTARGNNGRVRPAASESNILGGEPHSHSHMAGSQISLVSHSHRTTSRQNPGNSQHPGTGLLTPFYTQQTLSNIEDGGSFKHPHLQIRNLSYELRDRHRRKKPRLLLDGISVDMRGGEMLAVMTTNAHEGTTLLDTIAGRRHSSSRVSGEFILNGNPLALSRLGSRVSYVRKDYRLHPDITVAQTMEFYGTFKKLSSGRSHSSTDQAMRAKIILEDLGLTSVRHSLVSTLTASERQRLTVACQLLLNTDILVLDQPTKGMDIFDTFFLVTFLHQWTTSPSHPRITLITIHPPTFEIFSIFSKVALISTGRLMFYGHRSEMLPYFAFIEYPCPGFKNPSDYYIDLVTLDDLSSEALLESSQRIESLADSWRRRQEGVGEVGAPSSLTPKVGGATGGFFGEVFGIWKYTLIYTFPWNLLRWLTLMLISSTISILIGAIYWNVRLNVPQTSNSAYDRFGQHWTLMVITPWPILLLLISRDKGNMEFVTRDIEEGLYSRAAYVIGKTIIELPFVVSIFLAYIIPAYVMAGISDKEETGSSAEINAFFIFIGYMLLYLYTLRCFLFAATQICLNVLSATTIAGFGFLAFAFSAGYTIHNRDLGSWCSWIQYISPLSWLLKPIERNEFKSGISFDNCPGNPVHMFGGIMQRLDCGLKTGASVLAHYDMASAWPLWLPILVSVGFIIICYIGSITGFVVRRHGVAVPGPEKP